MRLLAPARRAAAAVLLAVVVAGCSGGAGGSATDPAAGPSTAEEAWSDLFEEANRELRGVVHDMKRDAERCFEGEHGARLATRMEADGLVYAFNRGECDPSAGEVRVRWNSQYLDSVEGDEEVLRSIPALYEVLLEDRHGSVWVATSGFVDAAEALQDGSGRYPATYRERAFEKHYFWKDDLTVDYRPAEDRRSFRVCLQHGDDGPWRSYDSTKGRVMNLGDYGWCTFDLPAPGSADELLLDVERLHLVTYDKPCDRLPADAELVGQGVLSEGNRVAACEELEDMEGLPAGAVVCVQRGDQGRWAVFHEWNGVRTGGSGECDLQVPGPGYGPYA